MIYHGAYKHGYNHHGAHRQFSHQVVATRVFTHSNFMGRIKAIFHDLHRLTIKLFHTKHFFVEMMELPQKDNAVIPAKAGIHIGVWRLWIPAYAGMTVLFAGMTTATPTPKMFHNEHLSRFCETFFCCQKLVLLRLAK